MLGTRKAVTRSPNRSGQADQVVRNLVEASRDLRTNNSQQSLTHKTKHPLNRPPKFLRPRSPVTESRTTRACMPMWRPTAECTTFVIRMKEKAPSFVGMERYSTRYVIRIERNQVYDSE